MNIEEYISSGVLELYAVGALTASEQAEVEILASKYPEVKNELDQIIQAYDQYASLHAITPPAQLKAKVLGAIAQNVISGNTQMPANDNAETTAKVIPMSPVSKSVDKNNFKWLIAASVSLLILSNALSIYFYQKWKDSENSLQLAIATQQQYATQVRQVQKQFSQQELALALVSDPNTQRVELKGVEKSPDSRVTVFWQKSTSKVLLTVNNLPKPAENQQYQLWAIADGKPVDAGLLAEDQQVQIFQEMKAINEAQAFAVTLEPKGGSVAPTLDQMYVMGAI